MSMCNSNESSNNFPCYPPVQTVLLSISKCCLLEDGVKLHAKGELYGVRWPCVSASSFYAL